MLAAVNWFRKAAEQGEVTAQSNPGLLYANGEGVANDDAGAVKWLGKAAEQGDQQSQYNLGVMYRYSRSIPRDYVQAHK
jgi:TPR repeat protein